jgi:hydrogenase expression/formation protein HypC
MCLGEVGHVLELRAPGRAVVDVGGRTADASLLTLADAVAVGDWLLVHSGFALAVLSAAEAEEALAIRSHAVPPATGRDHPPTSVHETKDLS